jgi:hypothetical protein
MKRHNLGLHPTAYQCNFGDDRKINEDILKTGRGLVICCVTFVYITIGLLSGQITFWSMGFKKKKTTLFWIRTRYIE